MWSKYHLEAFEAFATCCEFRSWARSEDWADYASWADHESVSQTDCESQDEAEADCASQNNSESWAERWAERWADYWAVSHEINAHNDRMYNCKDCCWKIHLKISFSE